MRYAIIALITMATLLATLTACSGQADTPDPTSAAIATQIAQVPEPTLRPTSPPPTRPKRIENIAPLATEAAQKQIPPTIAVEPPTQAPSPTSGQPPASQPAHPSSTTQPESPTSPQPDAPAKVPKQPQFTDEVLLQNIYKTIDLDRLALPEDYQIPPDYEHPKSDWSPINNTDYQVPYYDVFQHPYLHVFPTLEYFVKKNADSKRVKDHFEYDYRDIKKRRLTESVVERDVNPPSGISHFLHYPWFEPFSPKTDQDWTSKIVKATNYNTMDHHFGNNSTRGVLADTVTKLFEKAAKPGTRSQAIYHPWDVPKEHQSSDLGEYLRTPFDIGYRHKQDEAPQTHVMPVTRWEIIHPELPIVLVTSYSTTVLPLTEEPPPVSQMTPEQILERLNRTPKVKEILEPIDEFVSGWHDRIEEEKPEAFAGLTYSEKEKRYQELFTIYKEHKYDINATIAHTP